MKKKTQSVPGYLTSKEVHAILVPKINKLQKDVTEMEKLTGHQVMLINYPPTHNTYSRICVVMNAETIPLISRKLINKMGKKK